MQFNEIFKRIISLALLLCMLVGLVPATGLFSTNVIAAESWDVDEDGTLSILCIGNSFSVDAMQYVYQIAENLGITKIYLGNLYIGGCSLATHWTNASGDKAAYTYYYNNAGSWKSSSSYKMSTALSARSWDYISMQQASPNSGQADTYNSNLTNLVSYVKGKAPNAKLVWHMTWAYQANSTHSGFANYGKNQNTMYSNIVSATQSKIVTNSDFSIVVPNGTAIQNARTSLIKDNLCRDGYHLNTNIGRYIAGLTVVKAITGLDISNVSYRPTNVPDAYRMIAIESANNAVATPFAKTTSAYTNPATAPANTYYTTRAISWKALGYWQSTHASDYNKQITTASNSSQYYSTQRFNSYTLPVGSVITMTSGSGWKYRPEAWLTDATQTSRPGNTTSTYTVCSDEWWKNGDGKYYLYRAFNLSKTDNSTLASNLQSTLNGIFKIYVPKEYTTSDLEPEALYSNIENLAAPIPNNSRVKWGSESDITAMTGKKYILVYGPSTGGSTPPKNTYAWDPTTPRLFGTFHAAPVKVTSDSGVERVYNADTSWQIKLEYDAEFDYTQAEYTSQPSNQFAAAWKVILPVNNLDTDSNKGLYLSNNVNYSTSNGYASSLSGTTWRLRDSDWYGALTEHKNSSGTVKTTAAWSKRNARSHLYFNWNSDRMHFFFWPQFRTSPVAIGDKKAKTSVRSMFTNPGSDDPFFSLGTTELGQSDAYACFYLYQVDTTKANTEKLYAKLKEIQKYILVDHTYFEAEYAAFLDALNTAYSVYGSCNGNASSQSTVDNALNNLIAKTKALNAYNQVEYMSIPYNQRINAHSKINTAGALEGTYFIDRVYNGNIDAVHSFINPNKHIDTNPSANSALDSYAIQRLKVTSLTSGVQATDISSAYTLHYVEGTTTGYTIQLENTNFLRAGSTWDLVGFGNPQTFHFMASTYTSFSNYGISIFNAAKTYAIYCDAGNTYHWQLKAKTDALYTDKPERFDFQLYQLSPTTLELYRALQFIQPYCDQDQAIKRYPQDLYKQFLSDFKSAMSAYTTYNTSGYFSNASAKTICDNWAKTLRAWVDTLTQTDSTLSYIDIPVEIFDFKSDGILFEYDDGSYYNLVTDGNATTLLPGSVWTDANGVQCRRGLTEDLLVDGMVVYKEQTITNVAEKLLADDATRGNYTSYLDTDGAAYNKEFFDKVGKLTTLGTFAQTLAKTDTGKNGGNLDWNEVTTAFDMAYYVLTYLWREVPQTDANKLALSANDTYNIRVPEREVLRLYKEETSNLYTFYSDNNMAYNGYYMYNTVPSISNPNISNYADFTPLTGLGFEKNGVETDSSRYYAKHGWVDKYATDNYHYVVHAYGSFVYYEDQGLYFQFLGDDDVYFYIDNKIAMDLGGAHSAVGDTLYLKDFTRADGTKLVDGEVYTFDMYYTERHTHASNMKFYTNIKIVDTDTLTTKGQYVEISGDNDMVDKTTGMGGELLDNGLVRVGDTVAYSFDVVNSHDVAIYDLIFEDKTLGTYLSKNIISLGNEELTNVATAITDIEVYYRTSSKDQNDNITVNNAIPVAKTIDEIKAMINTANTATATTPGTSLPEGSYRVTMRSEQDLMDLLELGVPANCQISIYGFKRYMIEDDQNTTITNTLTMSCSYLPWASNDTEDSVKTLSGTASRILKVASLSGIPATNKVEYAMDYGKAVEIAFKDLVTEAEGVTINGFVGFTKQGSYNNEFLKAKPTDLSDSRQMACGNFTHDSTAIYYRLDEMITQVEKIYAVFSLSGCEITDANGKAREYPYMLAEITIYPATSVYYETEKFDDFFTTTVKNGTAWTKQSSYITDIHDSYAVNDYDAINEGAELYFDFTNRAEDAQRYSSNSYYGGRNYDTGYWTTHYIDTVGGVYSSDYQIDNQGGTLALRVGLGNSQGEQGEGKMYGPELYLCAVDGQNRVSNPALNYTVPNDGIKRYVQVRFKTIDCVFDKYEGSDTSPAMILRVGSYSSLGATNQYIDDVYPGGRVHYDIHNDEYITLTAPLNADFAGLIGYIGLRFRSIRPIEGKESTASVVIDYIYIGTEDGLPSLNEVQTFKIPQLPKNDAQNVLYFGFDNSELARNRYSSNTSYLGFNFDSAEEGHWVTHYVSAENVSAYTADYTIHNINGVLMLNIKDGYSGTLGKDAMYGPEIFTAAVKNTFSKANPSLQFVPTDAEYMYVRLKTTNCMYDPGDVGEANPKMILRYTYWDEAQAAYVEAYVYQEFVLQNDRYITLKIPMSAQFMSASKIGYIGLRFRNILQATESGGSIAIDYIYFGPENDEMLNQTEAYGYDLSYTDDESLSNGQSLFVNGAGVPTLLQDADGNYSINYSSCKAYTEATFSFTGTGFDIISHTDKSQGALRVVVCDSNGKVEKIASVINTGIGTLYQIPVLSVEDLAYGEHTVHIFVNAAYTNNDYPALNRGGEFYFDAVRIYNPVDENATDDNSTYIQALYQANDEALAKVTELRNMLIDAQKLNESSALNGIVYLDANADSGKTDLANYTDVGPNNELYLDQGNAIAFKLVVGGELPTSIDIGAKSVNGKPIKLYTSVTKKAPTALPNANAKTIASCTAQYYPLNIVDWDKDADGNYCVYIALLNNSDGLMSITDVKLGYGGNKVKLSEETTFTFKVDRTLMNALMGVGEEPETVVDPSLNLTPSISIGAEMQVVYTVAAANVDGFESFYLQIEKEVADGEAITTIFSLENGNLEPISNGESVVAYRATYTGIFAKEMGDVFNATLCAIKSDGMMHCSEISAKSIQGTLFEKLNNEQSSDELKTLCVDMLNYGAAAQVNFNYNVENLVNAKLTEEQKALGTQVDAAATDMQTVTGTGAAIAAGVSVQNKVFMYLTVRYAATDASKVKFIIKDSEGKIITELIPTALAGGKVFQASYDGVGAKQMREPITIEMQEDGVTVSQILTWSVESYVAQTRASSATSESLMNMVNALLIYGDSAAVYLAK